MEDLSQSEARGNLSSPAQTAKSSPVDISVRDKVAAAPLSKQEHDDSRFHKLDQEINLILNDFDNLNKALAKR